MIDTHELKKRDLYLNKIIAFQDTEPVKVVTGIRRWQIQPVEINDSPPEGKWGY